MATPIWPILRIEPVKYEWQVELAVRHGARADGTAHDRQREDADPECLALGWCAGEMAAGELWRSIPQPVLADDGTPRSVPLDELPAVCRLDLAIADRLAATGAIVRGDQAQAVAFIIGISPAWLEEVGDSRHDPHNPRLRQLWDTTICWVNAICGEGAVVAARADIDEMGGGVIDIWAVPVFWKSIGRNRKDGSRPAPRPVVAVSFAFDALNEKYKCHRAEKFKGAQEDWYQWVRNSLEPRVQRGLPAKVTRRKHLPPGEWAKYIEDLKKQAAEAEAWATLAAEEMADAIRQRDDTYDALTAAQDQYAALTANTNSHVRAADEKLKAIQHIEVLVSELPEPVIRLIENPRARATLVQFHSQVRQLFDDPQALEILAELAAVQAPTTLPEPEQPRQIDDEDNDLGAGPGG